VLRQNKTEMENEETFPILTEETPEAASPETCLAVQHVTVLEAVPVPETPAVKEVIAPATTGVGFKVKKEWSDRVRSGQLLVLLDTWVHTAAVNVIKTYLPSPKETGVTRDMMYLGVKPDRRYLPIAIDMRIEEDGPLMYRMRYVTGHIMREWQEMDLATMKLRTTEEQRTAISVFAGIIYRTEESVLKDKQKFIGCLDAAGVNARQLKDKLRTPSPKGEPTPGRTAR